MLTETEQSADHLAEVLDDLSEELKVPSVSATGTS